MTEDLDIEAMLEAPYRKERESKNGTRSDSDSDDGKKRHKKRSKRSRSRSREKHSKRSRSGSRDRRSARRSRSRSRSRERKSRSDRDGRRRRSRSRSKERRRMSPVRKPKRSFSPSPDSNNGPAGVRGRDSGRDLGGPHVTSLLTARQREKMIEEENISQEERDARTVFIMQLARNITIRDIEEFFSKVGQVRDVRLISDRNSRRSKGIGYVEFTDKTAVPLAINLSGQRLLGVPIMVQPTMAEKNRVAASQQALSKPQGPTRLYVGSLHYNISEQMLKAIFEPFGFVDNVQLIYDTETSRSKGYGFVTFKDPDAAKRALDQLNGFELAGRPMKVGHVTERSDGSMSFLDDEETEKGGIEMNAASRAALMQKLAATHAVGMQVPSAPMVPAVLQTPLLQHPLPSSCLLLSNMFDPAKETDPGWDDDIKNDVLEEISKYGSLVHIHVDRINPEGNVYMKCSSPEIAATIVKTFNGRWFAGRTLKAGLIPLQNYHTLFPQSSVATVILRPNS